MHLTIYPFTAALSGSPGYSVHFGQFYRGCVIFRPRNCDAYHQVGPVDPWNKLDWVAVHLVDHLIYKAWNSCAAIERPRDERSIEAADAGEFTARLLDSTI